MGPKPQTRAEWVRRGKRLEHFTVLWNCMEGMISIAAGIAAGSVALVGFGFDSAIEVGSGVAVLWRLHGDHDPDARARKERRALRAVGVSFVALAAYVAFESISTLRSG